MHFEVLPSLFIVVHREVVPKLVQAQGKLHGVNQGVSVLCDALCQQRRPREAVHHVVKQAREIELATFVEADP